MVALVFVWMHETCHRNMNRKQAMLTCSTFTRMVS